MGKQSTRENKTIYQICREEAGLTRLEASEKMTAVSDSKIEKFEYEMQEPTPYDIIQMADAYGRPDLCNYYCSHKCEIGHRYVPEVEVSDLSNIILETIASLNEINPLTTRLIQIARDGKISDDEIYNAILWHTTGKPDMTVLEKVIYLADFIEPTRDFPGVDALRRTVWEDLDRGLLMGLEMTVEEMEEMGNPIHVNTLAARDYLKGKTNEGKAGSGQQL